MPPSHLGALESIGRICVVPFTKGPTFHFRWLVTATIIKTIRIGRARYETCDVRKRFVCQHRACEGRSKRKASPNGSNSIPCPHDSQDHGAGNLTVAHVWAFGRGYVPFKRVVSILSGGRCGFCRLAIDRRHTPPIAAKVALISCTYCA